MNVKNLVLFMVRGSKETSMGAVERKDGPLGSVLSDDADDIIRHRVSGGSWDEAVVYEMLDGGKRRPVIRRFPTSSWQRCRQFPSSVSELDHEDYVSDVVRWAQRLGIRPDWPETVDPWPGYERGPLLAGSTLPFDASIRSYRDRGRSLLFAFISSVLQDGMEMGSLMAREFDGVDRQLKRCGELLRENVELRNRLRALGGEPVEQISVMGRLAEVAEIVNAVRSAERQGVSTLLTSSVAAETGDANSRIATSTLRDEIQAYATARGASVFFSDEPDGVRVHVPTKSDLRDLQNVFGSVVRGVRVRYSVSAAKPA